MPRALKDILAGLVFVVVGLAFAVSATAYDIGTPVRMGPGYFPLVLGITLVGLGGLIVAKAVIETGDERIGAIPWRAAVLIAGAVVLFGLTVRGLGLIPTTIVTTLLAGAASRQARMVEVVLVSVGLTILSVLVFVVALSVRIPLVGPWLGA